ncbi:MAG: shikimate dehydrogenase [Chitinophagaceae bacterium]|nr:shikimate dehydrogenase [Chitinophagaceae bacterium]
MIGYPLAHSFSKNITPINFAECAADCAYETFPITTISTLKKILQQNPNLKGLNVTIPHKKSGYTILTDLTHLPQGLNACNCIKISNGKLIGFNTDAIGFQKSLEPLLKPQHTQALILGNGGVANAVKFVLKKLNIKYTIVGRQLQNDVDLLYKDLTAEHINEHFLIINTTPLGTFPNVDECPNIPYYHLSNMHLLYDLIYNPDKTLFLQKGEQQGAAIKNGYEMLLIQAEENWRIWNED